MGYGNDGNYGDEWIVRGKIIIMGVGSSLMVLFIAPKESTACLTPSTIIFLWVC